ncbi:hypothetical protein [Caldimonas brevitalea]|uniref:Uncharacterized protein n=1 Tax=Caldimonas brevitalea TaxID=413882 RepID=A0A0G3BN72_9BURK|nr:hypothetical protein [Caldimonas brevitalea]AKJ30847.1 hypothetical protein AAW51_4156 [Caldimonas brevitalea]
MISWRGLGFLGFMIPLALWGLALSIWGHDNFAAARVALLLAAVLVWVIGRKLNQEAREEGDEEPHQAFGFPMQWSVLLALGGVFLTFL